MSPISWRPLLGAFLLFVSTVCAAQMAPAPTAAPRPAGTSPDGVFRPAGSEQADQQHAAAQNPQQPSPVYTIGKEYRIGPNDLLDIEILNLDNGKRTVRVNAAGYITLPLSDLLVNPQHIPPPIQRQVFAVSLLRPRIGENGS